VPSANLTCSTPPPSNWFSTFTCSPDEMILTNRSLPLRVNDTSALFSPDSCKVSVPLWKL
jgi:hypothetical protein